MILVLDTETTGLPNDYNAPISDSQNWPRLVQLAIRLYTPEGLLKEALSFIIYPAGYTIPEEATAKHGISTAMAMNQGVSLLGVLTVLSQKLTNVSHIVAHNLQFDMSILGAEYFRADLLNPFPDLRPICTMRASTDYCAIPGPRGNKWPKLSELYFHLFGTELQGEHRADVDAEAAAQCFFELVARGVIVLDLEPAPLETADPFSPRELQGLLTQAYAELSTARAALYQATQSTFLAAAALAARKTELLTTGQLTGKNDAERSAQLATLAGKELELVQASESQERGARFKFEQALTAVEMARAFLRVAELAIGGRGAR